MATGCGPMSIHGCRPDGCSGAAGDFVAYVVPVVEPGTYAVRMRVKRHSSRGVFQLYVEGAFTLALHPIALSPR